MKLATKIFLGFAIIIGLSIINSYVNYILFQKVRKNSDFLSVSELIIRNSAEFNKAIIDMQNAFRGYLLTDNENFLKTYEAGLDRIPEIYKQQHALVRSIPSQSEKMDSIHALLNKWINYSNTLIMARERDTSLRTNSYAESYVAKLKAQEGKNLNDRIGFFFQEFDRYEYQIREGRRGRLIASITQTQYFSLVFIVLTIVIGLISGMFVIRQISNRIASMVSLADNISKGNFVSVADKKNDELASLSSSLNLMSDTLNKNIRELEKRNRELDRYAYVVSHDLKAPIRGIYNAIQWIEEDLGNELSPQMKKYLDIIPERIKRMDDLIDGLLDYARVSREQPLQEWVDVGELLAGITELIVPAGFVVNTGWMPALNTDRIRLEQVFSNLISNAVKYSPPGNGEITISCRETEDFYEFAVRDNGIGIDPEYHEKIFIIFQTLREKHAKESTGIGLAIVHKIIEDLHCSIRVESESGKGAAFIFTWPKN